MKFNEFDAADDSYRIHKNNNLFDIRKVYIVFKLLQIILA